MLNFRWMAAPALCASLASCGSAPAPTGATENVATLLLKDDPAACAIAEAVDAAIASANRQYVDYLQNGGAKIRTDTISATNIQTDIHEITCSAVIHNRIADRDDEQSRPFAFKLRPTLGKEAGGFVAEIPDIRGASIAVVNQIAWWDALNSKTAMDSTPSANPAIDDISPSSSPAAEEGSTTRLAEKWTPAEEAMIDEYGKLDGQCRGGMGDAPETQRACVERDREDSPLKRRLQAANICYGRESEYGYQNNFHRCGKGSFRF